MKKNLMIVLAFGLIAGAASADTGFLPGRIESRSLARTILVKCAVTDATDPSKCVGYQFYYSPSGAEADATPISSKVYTESSLKDLKTKPVRYNLFDAFFDGSHVDAPESYTVSLVGFLNDYEDSWGESTFARIAYGAGRGVCYGVLTPIGVTMDVAGTAVALPVTLVGLVVNSMKNTKIKKLIRAIHSGKKIPMDINRVYRLRDQL